MADLSSIGDLIAGFAPEGPLRRVVLVVYGLCAAIAPFIFKYYLGLLAKGGEPEGSIERQDYDGLRASLKEGNLAARLYAKWLGKFLDWIERFFGDAGMADRTLFPHAFGLKKPAPLWTAPALDRCLLLALIYPIATIFLIWAISGQCRPGGGRAVPTAERSRLVARLRRGNRGAFCLRNDGAGGSNPSCGTNKINDLLAIQHPWKAVLRLVSPPCRHQACNSHPSLRRPASSRPHGQPRRLPQ